MLLLLNSELSLNEEFLLLLLLNEELLLLLNSELSLNEELLLLNCDDLLLLIFWFWNIWSKSCCLWFCLSFDTCSTFELCEILFELCSFIKLFGSFWFWEKSCWELNGFDFVWFNIKFLFWGLFSLLTFFPDLFSCWGCWIALGDCIWPGFSDLKSLFWFVISSFCTSVSNEDSSASSSSGSLILSVGHLYSGIW